MKYQISSGNGPAECELAVTKLTEYLQKHYNAEIITASDGYHEGTYRSVTISADQDLSEFSGSILWVCKSPYRPEHKRKNWFIDFASVEETETVAFDIRQVAVSIFHCGGNGGQNVNKVETGVRAVYLPTGDVTECTEERSQYLNKKKALLRLEELVKSANTENRRKANNDLRKCHVALDHGRATFVLFWKYF